MSTPGLLIPTPGLLIPTPDVVAVFENPSCNLSCESWLQPVTKSLVVNSHEGPDCNVCMKSTNSPEHDAQGAEIFPRP